LERFALETGLKAGNDEYQRFIVLGRSRVGSNLLRGLLNSHPEIAVFGELFQNPEVFDWALPGHIKSTRVLRTRQNDPVRFIENLVFHRFPKQINAVGFKIFYYHAQTDNWKPVWTYLKDDKDIRVIHIKRRNLLKTHLSRKKAVLSGAWVSTDKNRPTGNPGSIHLDYHECLEDFQQTRNWENQYDDLFRNHPICEVIHEDLAADKQKVMTEVQKFLGVTPHPVEQQTYRQARSTLPDTIANFDEIKSRFQGTQWESFFEQQ
jgi:LPS sulfotransferase NodH